MQPPALKGARGFDCNTPVSAADASAFVAAGYMFAVRYIPREVVHSHDLSVDEVQRLWTAGLGVMPVQHVESESSWLPSAAKGDRYGQVAADTTLGLGLPPRTTVWLDLEGVSSVVDAETIIAYANAWHDRVLRAGFEPGIYVGWHARLTPEQLYRRLKFTRYWAAYNLNREEYPAVCGVCMRQGAQQPPPLVGFAIDGNTVTADAFGRVPTLAAPPHPKFLADT
jgi:hypothetical protein